MSCELVGSCVRLDIDLLVASRGTISQVISRPAAAQHQRDRDTLGFEVRNDVGYVGMRWITVGPVGQPDTSVVLQPPFADPGVTHAVGRSLP
jgi:hypothetical protein